MFEVGTSSKLTLYIWRLRLRLVGTQAQPDSRTCMLNPIPKLAKPNMALEHIETEAKVPSGVH